MELVVVIGASSQAISQHDVKVVNGPVYRASYERLGRWVCSFVCSFVCVFVLLFFLSIAEAQQANVLEILGFRVDGFIHSFW